MCEWVNQQEQGTNKKKQWASKLSLQLNNFNI